MVRATNSPASRKRRRRRIALAEGFRGGKHRLFRTATEAVNRAFVYNYRDRKVRKRSFRQLWIARLNAAVREVGMTYSRFIEALAKKDIILNRKMLSELAIHDKKAFTDIVSLVK